MTPYLDETGPSTNLNTLGVQNDIHNQTNKNIY